MFFFSVCVFSLFPLDFVENCRNQWTGMATRTFIISSIGLLAPELGRFRQKTPNGGHPSGTPLSLFFKKHHQINVECHLDSRFDSVHVIYILGPHIELLRMKFTHRRAIWLEHQSHKFMFWSMNWTLFLVIFWLSTVTLQFLSITSTHMACLGAGQTEWMGVSFEKPKGKINKVLDTHWSIHSDRWMRSHCGHMH